MHASFRTPCKTALGSVLIVVMLVCIGLISVTLVFANSMMLAYRGADNNLAGAQAEQAIEGGARYAEYLMTQVDREGGLPDPNDFQSDTLPVGDATFWFIGVPSSTDPIDQPSFGIVDEASKLNLNTATQEMLLNLPGMTPDLALAIVNWRSKASSSAASGTTSSIILNDSTLKQAPFESVEELALVISGTGTQDLLYGADLNWNHALDDYEANLSSSSGNNNNHTISSGSAGSSTVSNNGLNSGLLEYLTVFSREPNTLSDGTTARVNVTKPTATALTTLLTNTFGASRAAQIASKVRTSGTINSVLSFYIHSGMTDAEFDTLSPNLTAKGGTYVTGLVNAYTASATVLSCIPGIGSAKADLLITAREQLADPPASLAWVVPVLGAPDALQAGPYLTANSYQLSVDIAAVGRNGRGYRRTRFVIDNSTGTPSIVYRRNLTSLGWALGSDVRQQLAMKKEMK